MRAIHISLNFYSSIKTVEAKVLGGLWALEWAWHIADANLHCVRSNDLQPGHLLAVRMAATDFVQTTI